MANARRRFGRLLGSTVGMLQLLSIDTAIAEQQGLMIHGMRTTPEISAKCESYIDKSFGRGTGAEHHRTAGLAACIERGGD